MTRSPRLRKLGRVLTWAAVVAYFGFAAVFLSLRYVVLPHVNDYHVDIERLLSDALHLPVRIAEIQTEWHGLRPRLALHGFQVDDRQGRPGLILDDVAAEIGWTSLLYLELRLHRLEIIAPSLTIRRDPEGRLFVAGLAVTAPSAADSSDFSDWLLAQQRVVVRDAAIIWVDERRGAPPLELQHLNFHLQNDGNRHRFGLTADPPRALAARLDFRGDFKGDDLDEVEAWKGEAYAELDYADLAIWRNWVDYPVELPQGSGGLRLWMSFGQKQLTDATADIALANLRLRLAGDLPMLELPSVSGRLAGKRTQGGLELQAKRLALVTSDGIEIKPTDFQLTWSAGAGTLPAGGAFSTQEIDLGVLTRLAAYLPMDEGLKTKLAEVAAQGRISGVKAAWRLAKAEVAANGASAMPVPAGLNNYSLKARFDRLAMHATGAMPGFEGLSGSIDLNERGGSLELDSQKAALILPQVFADPNLKLHSLRALASWKIRSEGGRKQVDVKLGNIAFENQDAAGTLAGSYIGRDGEPGEIDINARVTRAVGTSVWRYMPLVVHHDVSDWLRTSIRAGTSNDATLRLKGDLRRFPFADGSGIFEVKGRFYDATLLYAEGWPRIDRIAGELEFVGKRMLIKANRGNVYGVGISDVRAEIADLTSDKNLLLISGKAGGPSSEFLRFVESSPVGAHIDHFTEDMTAAGNGQLALKLTLPLAHLADTRTEGVYQFTNNTLTVDADLPPLSEVNGKLQFSGDGLRAEKIRANLLGSPMTVDVRTIGNGTVLVNAEGTLSAIELRKQFSFPLLDHLSGSTAWKGTVRARKRNAEILLESRLQGLASSLPEPFNKIAGETQLLRIERKPQIESPRAGPAAARRAAASPVAPRDQIDVTLGSALALRLVRRHDGERGDKVVVERGGLAVGETLSMPDKGLLVAVNQKRIDADFWRRLMFTSRAGKTEGGGGISGTLSRLDATVALKSQQLTIFGHALNDLELKASTVSPATARDAGWRAEIKSRELVGDLTWRNQGAGRLAGRLKQMAINEASAGRPSDDPPGREQLKEMPGLDIEVDQLLMRGKAWGKLKLLADNRDGTWEARLEIDNDDGKLTGDGQWRPSMTQPDTHLKFTLNVKSVEKLLNRLGYPDAVRRGTAKLEGALDWNGTPFVIDYPSLNGALEVEASNGQFNKLEPGVGRLLGILSLQSLPRRITLDFRDIFSEGFAFNSISGQLKLNRGIMDTRNFQIQGPAAKIIMSGTVNLPQESQNLTVRVSPALTETLAVGAMLAHPAAGAIAWLADKILKNPLDQIFAYDYAVTGTWSDPVVEKLGSQAPKPPGSADKSN